MTATSALPGGSEYERIVEQVVQQLQSRAGVTTERISRDVRVPGRATVNQIDVLWDLIDAAGQAHRVVFEARSYQSRIKQSALHAFRSVVDDIQEQGRPVTGVMVTTTGYQSGAADVASTYGVIILELRSPTLEDLRNRVTQIQVDFTLQHIVIEALDVEAIEIYDGDSFHFDGTLDTLSVRRPGEAAQSLESLLLTGEVGTLSDPQPVHSVRRELDPPADLLVKGQPRVLIRAIRANVGIRKAPPVVLTIGGLESVAWMLRDAITGARAWIAQDGRVWSTPS